MSKNTLGKGKQSATVASKIGSTIKQTTTTTKTPKTSQAGGKSSQQVKSLAGRSTDRRSALSRGGGPRGEPQTWNPATWSRRRRVICVISGSGAILFLMSVIFTLVISSLFLRQEVIRNTITPIFWPESSTTPTPFTTTAEPVFTGSFVSLPRNLSQWCRDLTRDPCAYHKKRFVTDCQKMTCSTVAIKLNRDIILHHDGIVSARLEFRHIVDDQYGQVVTPPQGGLCLLPERKNENDETSFGRCRNQQCDPTPDSHIRQYLKFPPVDGQMVDASALTKDECFAAGPDILTSFPVLGVNQCGKTKVHNRCVRHPIILRKCSPPELGGKSCYDGNGTPFVFVNQTPLTFGDRCDCGSDFDHLQNMICNKDLNGKTQCGYMVDGTDNSFGDLVDDFYGCCLADTPEGSRAMCIVGNCITPFFR